MIWIALAVLAAAFGGTLVTYTTVVINSGQVQAGDEAYMVTQIFIGLLLLLIVHVSGVLW